MSHVCTSAGFWFAAHVSQGDDHGVVESGEQLSLKGVAMTPRGKRCGWTSCAFLRGRGPTAFTSPVMNKHPPSVDMSCGFPWFHEAIHSLICIFCATPFRDYIKLSEHRVRLWPWLLFLSWYLFLPGSGSGALHRAHYRRATGGCCQQFKTLLHLQALRRVRWNTTTTRSWRKAGASVQSRVANIASCITAHTNESRMKPRDGYKGVTRVAWHRDVRS